MHHQERNTDQYIYIYIYSEEKSLSLIFKLNQRASNVPSQYMGYIQDNECYVKANRLHRMVSIPSECVGGLEQKLHTFPSVILLSFMTIHIVNQEDSFAI